MEDKIIYKRVKKDGREGMIFNYVEVSVNWDGGGCTREKLKNLEFIDTEKEKEKLKK